MSWEDYREFELVYRENARLVYRFLVSRGCPPQEAEDLTQDTFVKALLHIHRFKGECRLSVWLCQIAKHLFYQHVRKRSREEPLPEEDDGLPPLPSAEAEAIDRDGQLSLLRRIHALPEPGREVVYLRTFGGLSFREIGEVLGRTETWARVTFYRSKEQLKKRRGTR